MDDNLKNLVERNLALTEENHEAIQKIRKYIVMTQILGVIKFIVILAPIIFAIIYLPPILRDLIAPYQELMPDSLKQFNQIDMNNFNSYIDKFSPDAQ